MRAIEVILLRNPCSIFCLLNLLHPEVINQALMEVLLRYKKTVEYRYQVSGWKAGDQSFVPKPAENWMQKVTLPSSVGKFVCNQYLGHST